MLKGDLALFSLGEILQSLAINTHTGTLKICTPAQEDKLICFQRGEIVYYSDGAQSDRVPQIGEILVRMQIITQAQLEDALAEQRESKELLGEVLIKRQMASEGHLRKALETQALEGLHDLFLLRMGTFEFQMNVLPDALQEGIWKRVPIALNTNSVIMEGLRQVDEWSLINRHVSSFDEIFRRVDMLAGAPADRSGLLLELCDGTRPVKDLFRVYPASRFECSKRLCQFVQAGLIRPLTEDECLQAAEEKLAAKQYAQAVIFFSFAAQLRPIARTIISLGDAFAGAFQEAASRGAYLLALKIAYEQEDFQTVAEIGEKLLPKGSLDEVDLERVFFSYVRQQNFKRAASTGNQLVAIRQKNGDYDKAAIVMEAIAAMDPNDLNLKIQAATLFEKAGNTELATRELEEVAQALEREKKYRELLKILRLLSQINPKRQDLKQKVSSTQTLIEQLDRRHKFHVTVAGVTFISLLVLTVVPFLYEVKARECFGHAQRLEQTAMLTSDFTRAKDAYMDIVKGYCFSTKVAEAQEALERMSHLERTYLTRLELQSAARKEEHESKMFAVKEELSNKLREAESAEQSGDLEKAHGTYVRILTDFAEVPATKNITFPLRILSDPSGATVAIDGAEIGKTPFVHRYRQGATLNLTLSRSSCVPMQQTLDLREQWEVRFKLDRKPLGEFTPVPAIHQRMVIAAKRIVLPSRDGNLYGVDPATKISPWQRVVGRYGDRVSDLEVRADEVYLGTVTGEVTAISATTGKSRWIAKVGSSVLAAPAVSADGKLVAVGTTAGAVFVLSNENGAPVAKLMTENEILAKPLFAGGLLLAGSTDDSVYAYSLERQAVIAETELSADVVGDLTPDGPAFLTYTADGTVHCLDSVSLKTIWSRSVGKQISTSICVSPVGVHVGTATGVVLTLDRKTGEPRWELAVGKGTVSGICLSEKRLYVTLESGRIAAIETRKGTLDWSYQSDMCLLAAPVLLDGFIYVGGMTGKFQCLEAVE